METAYQKVKVHNELEWCQVFDEDTKDKVEKLLLKNRISYYMKWEKPGFFSKDKFGTCTFCVNMLQKDAADAAILPLYENDASTRLKFLNKKMEKSYY